MNTKKVLLIVGTIALVVIVAIIFWPRQNKIILKVPIVTYKEPGNILSETMIAGYSDKPIKKGEEFIVESASLGTLQKNQAGDIKLKIIDIKNSSVVIDVLADKQQDQNFHPRAKIERQEISSGSCINAYPLVSDVSYQFCFTLGRENGITILQYNLRGQGTMPTP